MHSLGTHLLIDLKACSGRHLNDVEAVRGILVEAATLARATVLGAHFHAFSPCGVSGMVIIAESHLSIHTWPEHRFAAVDLFTCGDTLEPQRAVEHLIERFECAEPSFIEVRRGLLSPTNARLPHKITPP